MGLDMYLTARRSVSSVRPPLKLPEYIPEGLDIDSINVDAAYWRKANAIHNWFVEHVQNGSDDCREYEVDREELVTLRDIAQAVWDDPTKAEELLPTKEGFFFGPTVYDDWYLENVRETVEQLTEVLSKIGPEDPTWSFYYQSSW